MITSADVFMLHAMPWQIFGSLTVAERNAGDGLLVKRFFSLGRRAARMQRLGFETVPWVLRLERGRQMSHRHLHFLMAGLRDVTPSFCFALGSVWRNRVCHSSLRNLRGTADIRLFRPCGGAAEYLAKLQNDSEDWGWRTAESIRWSVAALRELRSLSARGLGPFVTRARATACGTGDHSATV